MTSRYATYMVMLLGLMVQGARSEEPTVSNVRASQRAQTRVVNIFYDLAGSSGPYTVTLGVSTNHGVSYDLNVPSLTGNGIGSVIAGSNRHIVWNAGADWPGQFSSAVRFKVTADDGMTSAPSGMVLIPGGTNSGNDPDFGAYSLTVSSFYMDRTQVTKALWDEVYTWAVTNGYSFDNDGSGSPSRPSKGANHPVHTVNWYDVVKWCNARSQKEGRPAVYTVYGAVYKTGRRGDVRRSSAAGYRLPTDVEWEYAARGGVSSFRFPWGNEIQHARANYWSSSSYSYDTSPTREFHPTYNDGTMPYTSPVGSFPANGYGLYDMAGNVWEWCFTQWAYGSPPLRVLRGGCYARNANNCRAGSFISYDAAYPMLYGSPGYSGFGFRSVLPPGQQ